MTRDASGQGWVMVPIHPTHEMVAAGAEVVEAWDFAAAYVAMLAARPQFVVSEAMVRRAVHAWLIADGEVTDEEWLDTMCNKANMDCMRAALEAALGGAK